MTPEHDASVPDARPDPMRVLVAGGAGYIGSVVTRLLLAEGHRVTVLDDLSTGHADAVPDGAELVRADIADAAVILGREPFDGELHFAAKSLVGESVRDPAKYWRTNVCGTRALLDAVAEPGVPRLVFSSTAATYGEPDALPITEDSRTTPTNPYGASKLSVDMMLTGECAATGLAAVSLRYFNVAGAAWGAGERHGTETHLIPLALDAVAGRRGPLTIFGEDWPTDDGTPIRDYIHVADLARAHVLALTAARPGTHLICNLGSGEGYSVRQVLDTIAEVTGSPVPATVGQRRAGDPARLIASNARAREVLGWRPERTLADMVRDAWDFAQHR
jgi:UDP-glucose 4-epimerase